MNAVATPASRVLRRVSSAAWQHQCRRCSLGTSTLPLQQHSSASVWDFATGTDAPFAKAEAGRQCLQHFGVAA